MTILAANFIGDSLMTALDPRGESVQERPVSLLEVTGLHTEITTRAGVVHAGRRRHPHR